MNLSFNFITNNVNGLGDKKTRHKLFRRLQDQICHKGVIFMQETHSCIETQKKWEDEFGNGNELLFSHGKSNARGVAIGFCGNLDYEIKKIEADKEGRFLILEVVIKNAIFIFINFYNENNEGDQLKLMEKLEQSLDKFEDLKDKNIILAGDFNFIFDLQLEAKGGNPKLKKNSIAKFIKIKEKYDIIDIWRARNNNAKKFTFRQSHFSGILQKRLDFIFVSNGLQYLIKDVDIGTALSSDHSPVKMSVLESNNDNKKGPGYWKFNKSLLDNPVFIENAKNLISDLKQSQRNSIQKQANWELMKYEIRKYCIKYSKAKAKDNRKAQADIEARLKVLEETPIFFQINEYITKKAQLDQMYDNQVEGARIRSKCKDYELGEKSNKYFLNLEKHRAKMSSISRLVCDSREVSSQKDINNELHNFYKNLYSNRCTTSSSEVSNMLSRMDLKVLNQNEKELCKSYLTEEELYNALMEMNEDTSPGNDGLTVEFYKYFWIDVKFTYIASVIEGKLKGVMSTSQRQAIIKLIEKKDKDKLKVKNWRPISLLNVDLKIVSKALAKRIKEVLPSIISSEQTAYVKNRFIGEGGRLISDILEVSDTLNLNGYMVTIDFEKAFDSLNHKFLVQVLKKVGFPDYFIEWIKIFLNNQESCVVNNGTTTQYFKLQRGARQGDPISAYLFIISLEVLFEMIKNDARIKPLDILNETFLYSAYADDATFFFNDLDSVKCLVNVLKDFYKFSDLKPNYEKCEIAGIGASKGALGALWGMKSVDLSKECVKILGIYFSYDKILMNDKNFIGTVEKIEKLLNIWRQRQLTLEGKIVIFKTLAISKIVHVAYLSIVPKSIIEKLEKIQNEFIWNGKKAKINNKTLCNKFHEGGLQKVDIQSKIEALQLSWIKRLKDEHEHQWKKIPEILLKKYFGYTDVFFPHFNQSNKKMDLLPLFYKNIVSNWAKCSSEPIDVRNILGQYLWNNKHITIAGRPFFWKDFASANVNHIGQLCENGAFKSWNQIKRDFVLNDGLHFKYMQLVNSIPFTWKEKIIEAHPSPAMESYKHQQGILLCTRLIPLENLNSKQIYDIILRNANHTPTAQKTLQRKFPNLDPIKWKLIYMLHRKVTKQAYARNFQYKILNNILYLNNRLALFGKSPTKNCSFCNNSEETAEHLFVECSHSKALWHALCNHFRQYLTFPTLTTQSAHLGYLNETIANYLLLNHILLIYKIYVYNSREAKKLSLIGLLSRIEKIFYLEIKTQEYNRSDTNYENKWSCIANVLT